MLLWQCNLATIKTFCGQPTQKRYRYSNGDEQIFTVVKEVLRNNYRAHNLIGHYHIWVISQRNSTLFTRPVLTRRCARAGHETRNEATCVYYLELRLPHQISKSNFLFPASGVLIKTLLECKQCVYVCCFTIARCINLHACTWWWGLMGRQGGRRNPHWPLTSNDVHPQ